ncbi:hypothetical protein FB451DRAFT_1172582 [Mycena latifolia]|nr:hypothetical protein FB451DRAFT_1172582 [Mycena latifolia]
MEIADIIVIPGTGLIISHGSEYRTPAFVACWDIFAGRYIGRLILQHKINVESAAFEEEGSPSVKVMTICVDYRHRSAVAIALVVSHASAFYPRRDVRKASPVHVDHGTVQSKHIAAYSGPALGLPKTSRTPVIGLDDSQYLSAFAPHVCPDLVSIYQYKLPPPVPFYPVIDATPIDACSQAVWHHR